MIHPDSSGRKRKRLDWRQVWTLYRRELRSALREKAVVINSILIPIFLYPLIMWVALSGMMFVHGQSERAVSRILVRDWPKDHTALRTRLERDRRIEIDEAQITIQEAERQIHQGTLDLMAEFLPAEPAHTAVPDNFRVRMTFNGSQERSATARDRLRETINRYRQDWVEREARERGIAATTWERFSIDVQNIASGKQMGSFVLGMVMPLLFVVMVAMGCFYPAIDSTAGERERNTWETLMSTAASRVGILTAKYLYVATLGGVAGAVNLAAMALTMKPIFAPMLAKAGVAIHYTVPLSALPILVLASVLLAGFVSAGMMIFASFARTFKEGQAMIMPFYLLVLLPAIFVQAPGLKFSLPLAFVPVVNVTMMVRSAVSGSFPWLPIAATVIVSLGLIAACIRVAVFVLKFEDVMTGSYSGSVRRFFRERVLRRSPSAHSERPHSRENP